jgi:hypothetical protein
MAIVWIIKASGLNRKSGRPLFYEQEGVDHGPGVYGDAGKAGGGDRHRRDRGQKVGRGTHQRGNPVLIIEDKPKDLLKIS